MLESLQEKSSRDADKKFKSSRDAFVEKNDCVQGGLGEMFRRCLRRQLCRDPKDRGSSDDGVKAMQAAVSAATLSQVDSICPSCFICFTMDCCQVGEFLADLGVSKEVADDGVKAMQAAVSAATLNQVESICPVASSVLHMDCCQFGEFLAGLGVSKEVALFIKQNDAVYAKDEVRGELAAEIEALKAKLAAAKAEQATLKEQNQILADQTKFWEMIRSKSENSAQLMRSQQVIEMRVR
jgi:hypothetical protein